MKKTSLYYSILVAVIAVQFISTVIGKSMAVQQSALLVSEQKQLALLEQQEADLINTLASKTSLASLSESATEYVTITKPVTLTPATLVATR